MTCPDLILQGNTYMVYLIWAKKNEENFGKLLQNHENVSTLIPNIISPKYNIFNSICSIKANINLTKDNWFLKLKISKKK